jgi:hypothetical protein
VLGDGKLPEGNKEITSLDLYLFHMETANFGAEVLRKAVSSSEGVVCIWTDYHLNVLAS